MASTKGKKKFIDKKQSVTFQLLHRDNDDPSLDPNDTSDRVFVPVGKKKGKKKDLGAVVDEEEFSDEDYSSVTKTKGKSTRNSIYDIDEIDEMDPHDYDYSKHFKTIGGGYFIPAEEGMDFSAFNMKRVDPDEEKALKAADSLHDVLFGGDEDPEIADMLDGEEETGDLDDDFIFQANAIASDDEKQNTQRAVVKKNKNKYTEHFDSEEELDEEEFDENDDFSYDEVNESDSEEDESKQPRNKHKMSRGLTDRKHTGALAIIDEQFEFVAQEYDDDQIGDLEEVDIAGKLSLENIDHVLDDFLQFQQESRQQYIINQDDTMSMKSAKSTSKYQVPAPDGMQVLQRGAKEKTEFVVENITEINKARLKANEGKEDKEEYEFVEVSDDEDKEHWDAETIVSTYSNLENHPTLIGAPSSTRKRNLKLKSRQEDEEDIKQIKLSAKTGIPLGVLRNKHNNDSESEEERENMGKPRPKGESKEEKRQRKQLLKEERKVKREIKKETKIMYKKEEIKQTAVVIDQQKQSKTVLRY